MTEPDHYRELMRPVVEGRKVIVAIDVLQGAAGAVPLLKTLGSQKPFLLSGAIGTGPVPPEADADRFVLDLPTEATLMGSIRAFEAALDDLPAQARSALDAYDPDREAIVLGSFFTRDGTIEGRRVYGGRSQRWEALEDKTVIDQLFDAAGVDRAPTQVVPVDAARAACAALDQGLGTAWAGDASTGWWGGSAYFRWVRSESDAGEAEAFFSSNCKTVRVMPFLEGIPCSIHGMVFDDTEIAFRPVEMVTLRKTGKNQLLYAGLATYWDPLPHDREVMRDVARKVSTTLRDQVDYRGLFTLDGVMTLDGFMPTELNPRPGAGLGPQAMAAGVHLTLLNKMVIEREQADFRPSDLEELIVSNADAKRGGGCWTIFEGQRDDTLYIGLGNRDGRYIALPEGELGDGMLTIGPSPAGGFVRYDADASRVEIGKSFASTAVGIFAFTDAEFGTNLGPLEAAQEVRKP